MTRRRDVRERIKLNKRIRELRGKMGGRGRKLSVMSAFYDREGGRIDLAKWSALMEFPRYRCLLSSTVDHAWVSTIWVGISRKFLSREPVKPGDVFETLVFLGSDGPGNPTRNAREWCWDTEDDARFGHLAIELRLHYLRERGIPLERIGTDEDFDPDSRDSEPPLSAVLESSTDWERPN